MVHQRIDTILTSTTWTCPDGVYSIDVEAIGAGGGGTTNVGGGGGGAYSASTAIAVVPGTGYTITVGTSAVNTNGGDSSFESTVVAKGGLSGTNGGTGGASASGTGTTKRSGGNGSVGTGARSGGGGASNDAAGSGASGGADTGGAGGSTTSGSAGKPDGGGGNSQTATASSGARGMVKITYNLSIEPGYPVVKTRTFNRQSSTTSHTISMPGGINAGDLLLLFFATTDGPTFSTPSGWSLLDTNQDSVPDVKAAVYYKVAAGGDSASITTGSTVNSAHQVFRITNYTGTPESQSASSTSGSMNPPSLTTSWTGKKNLWIAAGCVDWISTLATIGNAPSTFEDNQYVIAITGGVTLATSTHHEKVDTLNPGTWTNISDAWAAFTIAVQGPDEASWYNTSWSARVPVAVRATANNSSQSSFPVYVDLSTLPTEFHDTVKTDGGDIRVTEEDGTTEVPREVVAYDSSTDTGELHFLADVSNTEDAVYYIYYGNSSASDYAVSATYGANNVWDSSFIAVYHLGESTNGTTDEVKDSTANANHGTGAGSSGTPGSTTGKVGKASTFTNANAQYITVPDDTSLNPTAITMTAWVNGTSFPNSYNSIVHKGNGSTYYEYFVKSSGKLAEYLIGSGSVNYDGTGSHTLSTSTWYHAVMQYSSAAGLIGLIDGTSDGTGGANGNLASTSGTSLSIGRDSFTSGRTWNGNLDEVRISNVVRSSDWITSEYRNQEATNNFYITSIEELNPVTNLFVSVSDRVRPVDITLNLKEAEFNTPVEFGTITGVEKISIGFIAMSSNLNAFTIRLDKTGSPTDNVRAFITDTQDGTPIYNNVLLAASAMSGSFQDWLYSNVNASLTPGNLYFLQLERTSTTSDANYYSAQLMSDIAVGTSDAVSPYAPGPVYVYGDSAWFEISTLGDGNYSAYSDFRFTGIQTVEVEPLPLIVDGQFFHQGVKIIG